MKRTKILAILTILIMVLSSVAISAAPSYTFDDLIVVEVTTDATSVSVIYSLTQLAIDEGFSFVTTDTMINGFNFTGQSFTESFANLGLIEGSTTTASYYVEVSRTTTVIGTPEVHKLVSNSSVEVATYGDSSFTNASESWISPKWEEIYGSTFSEGKWIWNAYQVTLPEEGEVLHFRQPFSVIGTPVGIGFITIVADNGFQAKLNGDVIGTSAGLSGDWMLPPVLDSEVNAQAWKTSMMTLPVNVVTGSNLLEVVAINEYQENATYKNNPAGLIYELTYYTETYEQGEPETYGEEGTFEIKVPDKPIPPQPPVTYYTLTVNVVGEGSVPGFEGTSTFASGTNVNLEAILDSDSEQVFVNWSGDTSSNNSKIVVVMNGDKTVTATFEPVIIEEPTPDPIPEAEPEIIDEILDEITPESAPDQDIEDEALPQTGGIPIELITLIGIGLTGVGVRMKKK